MWMMLAGQFVNEQDALAQLQRNLSQLVSCQLVSGLDRAGCTKGKAGRAGGGWPLFAVYEYHLL